jgi:hypothetical protein
MPEEDLQATEANHAEEVLDVVLAVSEDTFDEPAFVPEAQKIATKVQTPFMRPALVTATSSPAQNGRPPS